jgi:fucose 4-O-acetylase-like acetyltransferase
MPGFAMWYLWALFVFRITLPYLIKIPHIIIVSFVISWVAGFYEGINNAFTLSRIICFLPYFLLGYAVRNSNSEISDNKSLIYRCLWGGVILLAFLIWEIFIYNFPGNTYATAFSYGYNRPIIQLPLRIALQLTIIVTGWAVIQICPNKKLWFSKYGSRTLNVYLLHGLIVLPFAYQVFPPLCQANIYQKLLMIIIPAALCLMLFSKTIDTTIKKIFRF